jgi:hypothetical protein
MRRPGLGPFWLACKADSGDYGRPKPAAWDRTWKAKSLALVHQQAHVSQQVIFVHRPVILHSRSVFIEID